MHNNIICAIFIWSHRNWMSWWTEFIDINLSVTLFACVQLFYFILWSTIKKINDIYIYIYSVRNNGQHSDIVWPFWHFVRPKKVWVRHLAEHYHYLMFIWYAHTQWRYQVFCMSKNMSEQSWNCLTQMIVQGHLSIHHILKYLICII